MKTNEYIDSCKKALKEEQEKSLLETNNWSHVNKEEVHKNWNLLYAKIAEELDTLNPLDTKAQDFISEHYKIVSVFYKPSKEAYIGMSLFYKEDEGMKTFHKSFHIKMLDFLEEAISIYAYKNL